MADRLLWDPDPQKASLANQFFDGMLEHLSNRGGESLSPFEGFADENTGLIDPTKLPDLANALIASINERIPDEKFGRGINPENGKTIWGRTPRTMPSEAEDQIRDVITRAGASGPIDPQALMQQLAQHRVNQGGESMPFLIWMSNLEETHATGTSPAIDGLNEGLQREAESTIEDIYNVIMGGDAGGGVARIWGLAVPEGADPHTWHSPVGDSNQIRMMFNGSNVENSFINYSRQYQMWEGANPLPNQSFDALFTQALIDRGILGEQSRDDFNAYAATLFLGAEIQDNHARHIVSEMQDHNPADDEIKLLAEQQSPQAQAALQGILKGLDTSNLPRRIAEEFFTKVQAYNASNFNDATDIQWHVPVESRQDRAEMIRALEPYFKQFAPAFSDLEFRERLEDAAEAGIFDLNMTITQEPDQPDGAVPHQRAKPVVDAPEPLPQQRRAPIQQPPKDPDPEPKIIEPQNDPVAENNAIPVSVPDMRDLPFRGATTKGNGEVEFAVYEMVEEPNGEMSLRQTGYEDTGLFDRMNYNEITPVLDEDGATLAYEISSSDPAISDDQSFYIDITAIDIQALKDQKPEVFEQLKDAIENAGPSPTEVTPTNASFMAPTNP